MIKATNLYKSFGHSEVLKDINLELNTGDINVLFGPSGSGKTTLCRNLCLLEHPDKGQIEILGNQYSFPSKRNINSLPYPKVSFVYQQLFLWPHLTNGQNILLAFGKNAGNFNGQYLELVKTLQIEEVLGRYPNEISIGQKQRVAIARALILNPEFIFLDEITSALDIVQTKNIADLIIRLKKQQIGILLITHNLTLFKNIADKFIFMNNGVIVEIGTKDIFTKPQSNELKTFLQ